MNNDASRAAGDAPQELPPWSECELFCIEDYAGAGHSPCGWRGLGREARRDPDLRFRCPRCGRATLLRIPEVPRRSTE